MPRFPLKIVTSVGANLLAIAGAAVLAIAFAVTPVLAATPQSVSFKSGDETVSGLLYLPASLSPSAGPHPAIVVIHEWWGLNDWIKEQASNYADQGYVTLAVDLYRGQVATTPDMAHELSRGLPQDRGVRDLVSAVKYLDGRKDVDAKRVGAVGWCMGGGYALQLAIHEPALRAVAINYGSLATDSAALGAIHAAVLGNFGGKDNGIPPASVNTFQSTMKTHGKSVDTKIYPDAGHAFENPNNKAGYRADDAADAQARMKSFFAGELQK